MNEIEKNIYIKIRAEQIAEFHDKNNSHNLKEPYPIDKAKKTATMELEGDLKFGKLRISLEDLLTKDNDTCNRIISKNIINRARELSIPNIRAIKWWKRLTPREKVRLSKKHFPKSLFATLSTRSIELIWNLENKSNSI